MDDELENRISRWGCLIVGLLLVLVVLTMLILLFMGSIGSIVNLFQSE